MIERFSNYNGTTRTGHWHNGSTCHGAETMEACADEAVRRGWIGKVLERTDTYRGREVKCYSLIAGEFAHWAKYGRYVAQVRLVAVPLAEDA